MVFFSQALQASRVAALLPDAHAGAMVPVGRVPHGGLLCTWPHALRLGAQRYLAGQQCRTHVGKPAIRPGHQPPGEPLCGIQRSG